MGFKIDRKHWGTYKHKQVELISIKRGAGKGDVSLTNYGARIVSVKVPDRKGKIGEITLGHNTLYGYLSERSYFGCTTGRVANRIANAEFDLDGKTYHLNKNSNGKHHLHGGLEGFDAKVWDIINIEEGSESATVAFGYMSQDGEEGYPGTLIVQVKFTITGDQIEIGYNAATDKPTIVNLTNHTYWNLARVNTKIYGHRVEIRASSYLETDSEMIPTGRILPVEGTQLDFREMKPLQDAIETLGGIDNNYVLDKGAKLGLAASAYEPATGRKMTAETDQPVIVFYTGNYLEGKSAWGEPCMKHQALCLETQQFTDAVHHPEFPSIVVRPRETYHQMTRYRLSTDISPKP
jgi:aldose 1-epimerase